MFTSVKFRNFKSLKDFTLTLKRTNVLVGPNNAGKSTILDGFRALTAAHAFASRRNPAPIAVNRTTIFGYEIPLTQFPISLENIHSDYNTTEETSIVFSLANGNKIRLAFFDNSKCVLATDPSGQQIQNTRQYKTNYPFRIASFPTLGPLEEEENLLSEEYFERWRTSRRAHRMFRNIWHRRRSEFNQLQRLVEDTWPDMRISPPELSGYAPPRLTMFCTERRIDREVCWAGFGFQVWLQLLSHILASADSDLLVVDEPEIYLHPDLQRRLFNLLRTTDKQVLLATHSSEIVNEAEHDEIVLVDRNRPRGKRIGDIDGLQEALFSIGSGQNVHLARLSKGRKNFSLRGTIFGC